MKVRHSVRTRYKVIIVMAVLIILAMAGVGVFLFRRLNQTVIPNLILKKVGFNVYAPVLPKQAWYIKLGDSSYNSTAGVLTLRVHQTDGPMTIVVTEQNQPDAFNAIPGYYNKLLEDLNQYNTVPVGLGTFTLTHPTELAGGQSAVADIDSTLMFAHPSKNLNQTEWTVFFDTLSKVN
jgi:hypothetical protein